VLEKSVHFFETKPFIMLEDSGFSGNFGTETQFVGRNKNTSARIVYYLKKRHAFGKMKMVVQDMEGNEITTLTPGKSKGINVVFWGFNMNTPKMAEGKTLSFGGFTSPRVPAGKYKIVLTKGKKTYEHIIELIYDDKSITSLPERKKQEELTMILFNMVEDLAYIVYDIKSTISKAQEVIDDHPKGKKTAQKAIKALNSLLEDLVITTGDNYAASAEPELREKMGNLYSSVATSYDRVSGAHKQNFEVVSENFENAKKRYNTIKDKEVKKLISFLVKNEIEIPNIKSKEDFLKKK